MKLIILFFLTISVITLQAQAPDYSSVCKTNMQKLEPLAGHWKGTAKIQRGPQPGVVINQEEFIKFKLDSVLLSIEGIGTQEGNKVFNALAIVNFDPFKKEFTLRSYLKEGTFTDAYFTLLEENKMEWGFEVPNGKIKYTIELRNAGKTWIEKGVYSQDGHTWYPFFESELVKVE